MQDVEPLLALAQRRAGDDKAGVRRAAVGLLEALLLMRARGFGGSPAEAPGADELAVIEAACSDSLVGVFAGCVATCAGCFTCPVSRMRMHVAWRRHASNVNHAMQTDVACSYSTITQWLGCCQPALIRTFGQHGKHAADSAAGLV